MTTQFPAAIDTYVNPVGTDSMAGDRTHAEQHGDLNDAVKAIEAKVGINGATDGSLTGLFAALALAGTALKGANMVGLQDAANLYAATTVEAALAEIAQFTALGAGAIAQAIRDELRRVVRPEHYGAKGDGINDDTPGIQAAFTAGAGGTVAFTRGKTYAMISGAARVSSFTLIEGNGAKLFRPVGSIANRFIVSNNDGVTGGYNATEGVTIRNLRMDGNYPNNAASLVCVGLCHSKRMRIENCYMKGTSAAHHIEINSSSDVVVSGCVFEDGAEQLDDSMEAIQIDAAISSATFFGGAPYDNTFCSNIKIINNTFLNCGTGVGTHTSVSGSVHTDILISGNKFTTPWFCGVRATNWANAVITNNIFYGGLHAVRAFADVTTINRGLVITGNIMQNIGATTKGAAGDGHAVYLSGNVAGTEQVQDWVISNNIFRDCNQTKSGSCIKTNYCPTGTISGNSIDGSSGTGAAISVFGNGAISIANNRIQNNAGGGISASSLGSVNIHDNIVNLISYTSVTNSLIHHNNTSAAGITGSGTNTGTNVSSNLQGGTFA